MQPPDGARNVARFRQNEFGSLVFGTTVFGTLARPPKKALVSYTPVCRPASYLTVYTLQLQKMTTVERRTLESLTSYYFSWCWVHFHHAEKTAVLNLT